MEVPVDGCGWWWCHEAEDRVDWEDLCRALTFLRDAGVDPCGTETALLASRYATTQAWASEKKGYAALRDALAGIDLDGDAARLQRKFLDELDPLIRNATEANPDLQRPGRGLDVAAEQVVAMAAQMGWKAPEIASALLLTGAERSSFESLRKRFVARIGRTKFALVP